MNKIKVCLIADFRSPHAISWLSALLSIGLYDVYAISTYSCEPPIGTTSFDIVPIDHSRLRSFLGRWPIFKTGVYFVRNLLIQTQNVEIRHWGIERDILSKAQIVGRIVRRVRPDIVHALRIPFEGVLAATAVPDSSVLALSVWGNDFTLFGSERALNPAISRAVKRANALHADTKRDIRLAANFGFDLNRPHITLPAGGGVNTEMFSPAVPDENLRRSLGIGPGYQVIINPRGIRSYVRTENFLKAAASVLKTFPNIVFVVSATAGVPHINKLVRALRIEHAVRLTPLVPYETLPSYYRLANIMVSPSVHDGTPNTLLESMSCGCFPIAGDIESIREWIQHGENGWLCNPDSVESISTAILAVLANPTLRTKAAEINKSVISNRASRAAVKTQVIDFYTRAINTGRTEPDDISS